jgi:hypothetical protein
MRAVATLLAAGCAATAGVPESLWSVPSAADPAAREVAAIRHLREEGRAAEALSRIDAFLARHGDHVDGQRLRQDILRARGRRGLVLLEAEQRVERSPDDPAAWYLLGRLAATPAAQQALFERAVELDPRFFWGWVGVAAATARTDPDRSLAIYQALYEAAPELAQNGVNLAAALIAQNRLDEAAAVYESLRGRSDARGVGDLGLARILALRDKRTEAWAPLLAAMLARPQDSGVHRLLEQFMLGGLPRDRLEQVRDLLLHEPGRLRAFLDGGGMGLAAELLLQLGDPFAAREALERRAPAGSGEAEARELGPAVAGLRRAWRRAALATGDVKAWLIDLRHTFPSSLLVDEANQVRVLWAQLFSGPWYTAEDPLADAAHARDLVRALARTGLLTEADRVATLALARHGADAEVSVQLRADRDEIRRELAFEAAMRRVLYAGYAGGDAAPALPRVMDEIRRLGREILGSDVVGRPHVFTIPFVGRLVDPFAAGIGAHFARHNRHLVLGQREGGPVEAMVLTRLSLRFLPPAGPLAVPAQCREVIGEDRSIRARSGVVGGDLAGVALVNGYVIDMDAVRDWAEGLRVMRAIAHEDGDALLGDPLPERLHPLDPLDAEWRLALASAVPDGELDAAVLDMIRWHEHAHLVDTFHFLPPERNLWRVLGLLFRNGFSPAAVEAEMEARAELAALALSPHTHLVLAHIASFCQQSIETASPHAAGFERLASDLQRRLQARGLTAAATAVGRWHELPLGEVRAAADALLRELW